MPKYLSPEEIANLGLEDNTLSNEQAIALGLEDAPAQNTNSPGNRSWGEFLKKQAGEFVDKAGGLVETPLSLASGIVGNVVGTAGGAVMEAVRGEKEGLDFENYLRNLYSYQPQTEYGKKVVNAIGSAVKPLSKPSEIVEEKFGPQARRTMDTAIMMLGPKAASSTKNAYSAYKTGKQLKNIQKTLDNVIDTGINKGVKPTVSGKYNYGQVQKAKQYSRDVVKDIVENKSSVNLVDDTGKVVSGGLPQSLDDFSNAVSQRKMAIFKEYDDIARSAGKAGGTVSLEPIAKELDIVAGNKVLRDLRPSVAAYAEEKAAMLRGRKSYTTMEAQDAISVLNNDLKAFYKNPSYEAASKVAIDAVVVNHLRRGLDDTINALTGKQYQSLKNKYGAYSAIEKDIARQLVVDARKNVKGLMDISDVFTGYHLMEGILSMNPIKLSSALASRNLNMIYKKMVDPNRQIAKMFRKADQLTGMMKRGGEMSLENWSEATRVPKKQIGYTPRMEMGQPESTVTGVRGKYPVRETNRQLGYDPSMRPGPIYGGMADESVVSGVQGQYPVRTPNRMLGYEPNLVPGQTMFNPDIYPGEGGLLYRKMMLERLLGKRGD